jgi:hypothetical protein
MFSDQELSNFKNIYQANFGSAPSDSEAIVLATRLIELMRFVYANRADEALNYFINKKKYG